jgi:hypothetical protein
MGNVSLLDDVCRYARTTQRLSRGTSTPTAGRAGHAGGTARRVGSRQVSRSRATTDEPTAGMGPRRGRGCAAVAPHQTGRAGEARVRAQGPHRAGVMGGQATRRAGSHAEAAQGAGPRRARQAEAAPWTPRPRAHVGAARPSRGRAPGRHAREGRRAACTRHDGERESGRKGERGWAGAIGEDEQGRGGLMGGTHP